MHSYQTQEIWEKVKLQPGTLVKGLKTRLLNLCDSPFVKHITLLTLGNQKILEGMEIVENIDKEVRTKKKTRGKPIVDANDVAKLLVSLIFVPDCLGKPELDAYNRQQVCIKCACSVQGSEVSVHFVCI